MRRTPNNLPGSFPDTWGVRRIGDVFEVQQGKAISPAARTGVAPRSFLRTANVLWGRLDLSTLDRMDFDAGEIARLALKPGDLLVCEGGEIGRAALWNGEAEDCFYQNHLHRLRVTSPDVVPAFVMYWLQAAFLHLALYGGVGNTTTIPNLSGARLKQLPIPLPPVPEQDGIVAALSVLQHAGSVQGCIVATLKELKAATMAKLFREGLRGEPLKQTEIGEIPSSWAVVRLGSVVTSASGGTPPKSRPEIWTGPVPWASPKDMKQPRLRDTEDHISERAAREGSRIVPAGSVFVVESFRR